ncbi:hypothetical protein KP509_02G105900 [Ceratopteris richardii]|uniref:Disease resistance R13L4/SHOC-2-like LRR domain-containing protein n=1 Tax=Ceratopteris richardii TaxID=49495 RepID=A0A8T2VHL8_CERRI|nr:hypothetical protein KP509_02G105900 [Ceratopteris richardii]KAH7445086.1 hypothetical protein KP509_02G105900 [Ceratopteris richardii]KAH7445087.1 hypothetical protein KP509_02G105900 [Ceratopteris richardii]
MNIRLSTRAEILLLFYIILFRLIHLICISGDYQVQNEEMEATMSAIEQSALYEVMNSMAGDKDWKTQHPHPCSEDLWLGLVCEQGSDGFHHVTRLDFGYKPNPACTRNATIPSAIAHLTHLRSLFIFECFSTVNTTIPVKSLITLAPTLQELSLRTNNALVGDIPPELGNLSRLQLLSLSQNGLSGHIPVELSKLSSLQHLDLSNNLLSGELPAELGRLQSLVILDLSVNSISGSVPSSLGNLMKLQKLDLSFNSFKGPLPRDLGRLLRLQFLSLNDNMITGPYPPEMATMAALQYLILDNNPMNSTLPSFIGGYQNLMALSLSNSGYHGSIPDAYSDLNNLTVMSLERNNLSGSIPFGLGKLAHIYQLNLSFNNLSGAIPFTEEFVRKLGRNLDLTGNKELCSHWVLPETTSKPPGGLPLCSDPKFTGLTLSFSTSRREMTFSSLPAMMTITLCIVYILMKSDS